ncbi:MAG: helix-turn-helix transcriptional regulator [Alphaproteobacteria bacterium]
MATFFTPSQIRAACGLVGWNGSDLAEKIGVSKQMMSSYLSGKSGLSGQNLEKIAYYFDLEGIEFTADEGVKRKTLKTKTYRGQAGFIDFMNLVYETAKDHGGEFCVSNVDEALFSEVMGKEADDEYTEKMKNIKNKYSFKILIKEGDTNFIASDYAEYRWVAEKQFHTVPFYVFGDNLAFLIFDGEKTTVHLINNHEIADTQRAQFNLAWDGAQIINA